MYIKDFLEWIKIKQEIDEEDLRSPKVRQGEIRWYAMGVNVGSEIDGKGKSFTRPVLIVKTLGKHMALVVPLSTTSKKLWGYVPFVVKDEQQKLCIIHTKTVSQKRLYKRIERISDPKLEWAKSQIKSFFEL